MYGHVEPVVGIQSNHPLTDPTVYDDDVVLHFNDGGVQTVHRSASAFFFFFFFFFSDLFWGGFTPLAADTMQRGDI